MRILAITLLGALLWAAGAHAQGQYRAFWADGFHNGYKTPQQVDKLVADARRAGDRKSVV